MHSQHVCTETAYRVMRGDSEVPTKSAVFSTDSRCNARFGAPSSVTESRQSSVAKKEGVFHERFSVPDSGCKIDYSPVHLVLPPLLLL